MRLGSLVKEGEIGRLRKLGTECPKRGPVLARNAQDPKSMTVVGKLKVSQRGCSRRLPADRAPRSRFCLERRYEPYISMVAKINSHSRRFVGGLPGGLEGQCLAMQVTWVQSLGRADSLEKGMATHSSILAWRIPMDREAWRASVNRDAQS